MFDARTSRIFLAMIAAFVMLSLPALKWPGYLDSPIGLLLAVPYLSIYLFDAVGVPGLLQNAGHCGWGWCAPSRFGWVFLGVFWLGVVWLAAAGIARLTAPGRER